MSLISRPIFGKGCTKMQFFFFISSVLLLGMLSACSIEPKLPMKESIPEGSALPIDGFWAQDAKSVNLKIKIEKGRIYTCAYSSVGQFKYQPGMVLAKDVKQIDSSKYQCMWVILSISGELLAFTTAAIEVKSETSLFVRVPPNPLLKFPGETLLFVKISSAEETLPSIDQSDLIEQKESANSVVRAFLARLQLPEWSAKTIKRMTDCMEEEAALEYFYGKDGEWLTAAIAADLHLRFWKLERIKCVHTSSFHHTAITSDSRHRTVTVHVRYYGYEPKISNAKGRYAGGFRTIEFQLLRSKTDNNWYIGKMTVVSDENYSYATQVWRYWLLLMAAPSILLVFIGAWYVIGSGQEIVGKSGCISVIIGLAVAGVGFAVLNLSGSIFKFFEKLGGDVGTIAGIGGIVIPFIAYLTHAADKPSRKSAGIFITSVLYLGLAGYVANYFFDSWWYVVAAAFIQLLTVLALFTRPWTALPVALSPFSWIVGFACIRSYNGAAFIGGVTALVIFIMLLRSVSGRTSAYR